MKYHIQNKIIKLIKNETLKNKNELLNNLFELLHISPSQKQKCLTFSLIRISRHPLAVLIPIAFAFISSSLVKHLLLAGVSF
jgi:hypothetical protein